MDAANTTSVPLTPNCLSYAKSYGDVCNKQSNNNNLGNHESNDRDAGIGNNELTNNLVNQESNDDLVGNQESNHHDLFNHKSNEDHANHESNDDLVGYQESNGDDLVNNELNDELENHESNDNLRYEHNNFRFYKWEGDFRHHEWNNLLRPQRSTTNIRNEPTKDVPVKSANYLQIQLYGQG